MKTTMALVIMLLAITSSFAQEINQISPIRAKLMARNGAVMIDVREKDEVKELAYDVDGILTIPLSEIETRLGEIPKDKDIILACASGNRSQKAATFLVKTGYKKISNMEGGIAAWQAKKLAVVSKGKTSKTACCANPNSKKCNPDGSCKKTAETTKACCSGGSSKKCSKTKK